jgi:rhamnose utilization protein RhaD (predicted bifunctional aldolase and dehydrogenase)/NAD(P)-dependent dehydrogenase (short-subunit alcohol dehydrogenase family)
MQNDWDSADAKRTKSEFDANINEDLANCIYVSRLIGRQPDLVLHGGGNTSVKTESGNIFGDLQKILYVKGSGFDLTQISAGGFAPIDYERATKLRSVPELSQEEMLRQLRLLLLDPDAPTPSVEAFLHAFLPAKFIVHTHPSSILGLTNQTNADGVLSDVLGSDVLSVPYIRAGFGLAHAAAKAFSTKPDSSAMILLQHGLVTWGETAEEAYAATIGIVTLTENYWKEQISGKISSHRSDLNQAWQRYTKLAPLVRGLLAEKTNDPDRPFKRFILLPIITKESLDLLSNETGLKLASSEPLTPDHLIRTKAYPLIVPKVSFNNENQAKEEIRSAIEGYAQKYTEYFERNADRLAPGAERLDPMPRVLMFPGIGVICAGPDERAAIIARDITQQSLQVKSWFAASGKDYRGIGEEHLFEMEYLLMQQAKMKKTELPLQRQIAVITGAAGAIGMGITEELLRNGCHVAITDLPGENLQRMKNELSSRFPHQIFAVEMDVTNTQSVENAFAEIIRHWGGIDLFIINAGIAMVSPITEMDLDRFRSLEKVNVEGTLLILREGAGILRAQGTGGDMILISTKNVFAPGAKFGAYSATKAAAHQLARIASLELAEFDIRVNMVAPDAVFAHGQTRSGLWAEVGPDRMKARGLSESQLEEYYKNRNLLKATVTAQHVGRAVLFFATRQTPTTGATLPVDGGLPDSTPR